MRNIFIMMAAVYATFQAYAGYSTIKFTLEDSEIYPGTSHEVTVTVPDSYAGEKEACLYIGLDGILCNAPEVMDSLMSKGEMPLTIGVFLQPGIVRDSSGNVLRYNRSNEFDATDGRFASFLERELLPEVESMQTADGRKIILSSAPSDRMIFGLSSGGIAAFSAAWNRPDLFARVFSGCGTFVPMRGGEELQVLVRKTEPKALRVFLQDGFTDTWNPIFGSWYEANRMLASALEFAGYDCAFDWAEGGHSVRRSTEIFADVMHWMWRDYPSEIEARPTSSNFLAPLLEGDGGWIAEENSLPENGRRGAAVYPDSSMVAEVQPGSNTLLQSLLDGNGNKLYTQRYYWLHSQDNSLLAIGGMQFDGNGYLWVVTNAGLQICDQNGRVRGILTLPAGVDAGSASLMLSDGTVCLRDAAGKTYRRKLNVSRAVPGVRPESQGPA